MESNTQSPYGQVLNLLCDQPLCACTEPILLPSGYCDDCDKPIHISDQARAKPIINYLLDGLRDALENGHNCENCIDREAKGYCSGLYWKLLNCHAEGVTEEMIRAHAWPDFPGWPEWTHALPSDETPSGAVS